MPKPPPTATIWPWERQPRESVPAYEAAWLYFSNGQGRSLEAVSRLLSKSRPLMARWSVMHGWIDRAAAYDAHLRTIEQASAEEAHRQEAQRWAIERHDLRDAEIEMARAFLSRARQMMALPLTVQKREIEERDAEGRPVRITQIINPAKWTAGDVVRYVEVASKLGRLAAEMETERHAVDVTSVRREAERVALELGVDADTLMAEARRLAESADQAQRALAKGQPTTTAEPQRAPDDGAEQQQHDRGSAPAG